MALHKSKEASPEQVAEKARPAVEAWSRLRPASSRPSGITLLKNTLRSTVCRIEGVGPGGSSIVAKWCPRSDGEREAFIYNEILNQLSLESVHCYGFVNDHIGNHGWLFLECGGNTPVANKGESLPMAFSQWLALLHGLASHLLISDRLPQRGPAWYLEILRTARINLCRSLTEQNWSDLDRPAAEKILICFEISERNWSLLEELCKGLPWTLVHCDLQPKNILIRHGDSGTAFLPLDWEEAGWGAPAPDLAGIDAVGYWSAVRRNWASIQLQRVEEQARCGALFQLLAAIGWEVMRLRAGSKERAIRRLGIYSPRLTAATKALGLEA